MSAAIYKEYTKIYSFTLEKKGSHIMLPLDLALELHDHSLLSFACSFTTSAKFKGKEWKHQNLILEIQKKMRDEERKNNNILKNITDKKVHFTYP